MTLGRLKTTAHYLKRAAVLATLIFLLMPISIVQAKPNGGQKSAGEAAQQAQAQYGGKVVGVSKSGNTYKVKLLQQNGRVKVVTISAR